MSCIKEELLDKANRHTTKGLLKKFHSDCDIMEASIDQCIRNLGDKAKLTHGQSELANWAGNDFTGANADDR